MAQEYHPDPDEILLFMGHGTEHVANELYPEMDELFKHFGYFMISPRAARRT